MRDDELWARLKARVFNGTGCAPVPVKLARAQRCSPVFTARVIDEYRRSLSLTQISARQVTPSRIVDAAWHMHLTYGRNYREGPCPGVIGKPVHHQTCATKPAPVRKRCRNTAVTNTARTNKAVAVDFFEMTAMVEMVAAAAVADAGVAG